jgi:cell division protein FtsQ
MMEELLPEQQPELTEPSVAETPVKPEQRQPAAPPKPQSKGNRLSVKGLVILLMGASIIAAWAMNDSWSVREIAVEGNHFTTTEAILKASKLAPGVKPDSLQALQVISRLEKLPYVAEARLEPNPPGAVKIVVVEREPIGLISNGNSFMILDNKGVKMPVVSGKVPDLPIVYGFSASMKDTLHGAAFDAVSTFLIALKKDALGSATIAEIGFDRIKGVVAVSQRGNVKLYFGHDQFDVRLKNLHAFVGQITRHRGLEAFDWIDFRFDHQVVTREIS